jgi:hypothetical protein
MVSYFGSVARDYVPMMVSLSPDDLVKGLNHIAGNHGRELSDCFTDLDQECLDIVPTRFNELFALVFAWVLPGNRLLTLSG